MESNHQISVKKMNKRSTPGRKEKISMLKKALRECTDQKFNEDCVKWMQECCNIDDKDADSVIQSLQILEDLAKTSAKFSVLGKPVCNSVVPRFTDIFVKKLIKYNEAWKTLETLMWHYNGPFATNKENLTSLMQGRMNGDEKISLAEAKCYALLPSAGGGGIKGTIHKANWSAQFDILIDNCHDILNLLFKDIRELQINSVDGSIDRKGLQFDRLILQLHNYCLVLQAMCLGRFPAVKHFKPEKVIDLIHRGVSVSGNSLGEVELATTAVLKSVIPEIHENLIKVFSALLVSCSRTLLPLASSIARIMKLSLQTASNSHVRLVYYACLSNWLVVAGSGSCVDTLSKTLVPQLLSDIQPAIPTIILRDTVKKGPDGSRNLMINLEHSEPICFASLETLKLYLNSFGYSLSPDLQKTTQEVVIRQLLTLQKRHSAHEPIYSKSERCRRALYTLLVQLCLEPSPRWPPPTQFAVHLLRSGANDSSPSVASICRDALSILDRIIHPEFRVAAFPIDYQTSLQNDSEVPFVTLETHLPASITSKSRTKVESQHSQEKPSKPSTVTETTSSVECTYPPDDDMSVPTSATTRSDQECNNYLQTVLDTVPISPKKSEIEMHNSEGKAYPLPLRKRNVPCSQHDEVLVIESDSSSSEECANNRQNPETRVSDSHNKKTIVEASSPLRKKQKLVEIFEIESDDESPKKRVHLKNSAAELVNDNLSQEDTPIQPAEKRKLTAIIEKDEDIPRAEQGQSNENSVASSQESLSVCSENITVIESVNTVQLEKAGSPEKKYNLRSKSTKEDVDSPMILRSGSLLPVISPTNGLEKRTRRRAGSISSLSSQNSRRHGPGSPRSDIGDPETDLIAAFDDALQSDA